MGENAYQFPLFDVPRTLPQNKKALAHVRQSKCQYGDIWQLGRHRLLIGDSTFPQNVTHLFQDEKAILVMADPPYGMGKEKDGIANDNLYREKLDAFQMQWWHACRSHLTNNAGVYIWGNAEDLWRLWYEHLRHSEHLTFRNEIVWDKAHENGSHCGNGMKSAIGRMYALHSERCLFFMLGEQEMSVNADNYWEQWTPLVTYLDEQRKQVGWSIKDTKRIAGHSENSGCHWFDKSQWSMPTRETYNAWKRAAQGRAFEHDYDTLKHDYDTLKHDFLSLRAYFDNTHEVMTDVWTHPYLRYEERYGHPSPKPVALIERILKTSSPLDSLIYDPFLGSGTTIVAAEHTKRRCYGIEISPVYCNIVLQRWEKISGKRAELLYRQDDSRVVN